ncbi:MAG: potassium channel family protein [Acidimicrobiales bacterium]
MSEAPRDEPPSPPPDVASDDDQRRYQYLAGAAMTLILTGTVVYHWLEEWSWVDSFYFSVVAATTVGFGDFSPTTDGSKLFTVAYIVVGISLIAAYLDARFKRAVSKRTGRPRR